MIHPSQKIPISMAAQIFLGLFYALIAIGVFFSTFFTALLAYSAPVPALRVDLPASAKIKIFSMLCMVVLISIRVIRLKAIIQFPFFNPFARLSIEVILMSLAAISHYGFLLKFSVFYIDSKTLLPSTLYLAWVMCAGVNDFRVFRERNNLLTMKPLGVPVSNINSDIPSDCNSTNHGDYWIGLFSSSTFCSMSMKFQSLLISAFLLFYLYSIMVPMP